MLFGVMLQKNNWVFSNKEIFEKFVWLDIHILGTGSALEPHQGAIKSTSRFALFLFPEFYNLFSLHLVFLYLLLHIAAPS